MPWVEALRQIGQETAQKPRNRYAGVSVDQCIGISVCRDTVSNHHGRGPRVCSSLNWLCLRAFCPSWTEEEQC